MAEVDKLSAKAKDAFNSFNGRVCADRHISCKSRLLHCHELFQSHFQGARVGFFFNTRQGLGIEKKSGSGRVWVE